MACCCRVFELHIYGKGLCVGLLLYSLAHLLFEVQMCIHGWSANMAVNYVRGGAGLRVTCHVCTGMQAENGTVAGPQEAEAQQWRQCKSEMQGSVAAADSLIRHKPMLIYDVSSEASEALA